MKKNALRLAKLEDKLVGSKSDLFRLSDFEILERIEALEFQKRRKPTQKFTDMKKVIDRTIPIFTPKVYQRMRDEQAERNAEIASMNNVELDDHLDKLIIESEMEETFEGMSGQELDKYNKAKKETLC
jgi:hypothetical protein